MLICLSHIGQKHWQQLVLFLIGSVQKSVDNIPYKVLCKKNHSLGFLHVFGMKAWVNIPLNRRCKGSARSKQLTFLGYQSGMKVCCFANQQQTLSFSRSTSFCENSNWDRFHGKEVSHQMFFTLSEDSESVKQEVKQERQSPSYMAFEQMRSDTQVPCMSSCSNKGISPVRFGFENNISAAVNHVFVVEQKDYQEVICLESSEKEAWLAAMQSEFNSITENQVFSLTELPKEKHCRLSLVV